MKKYTVPEFAKKLKVSKSHIYELIKKGEIVKVEKEKGAIKISSSELSKMKSKVAELYCNLEKVDIIKTHLGDIRKIKDEDWYVLADMASVAKLSSSYVIKERVSEINIKHISLEEARGYGLINFTYRGTLLISLDGIKEYLSKTKTYANWELFLEELNGVIQESFDIKEKEIENNSQIDSLTIFEGQQVEIIELNGEVLFELYSTGLALGQVVTAKGKQYPNKDRIDKNVASAELEIVLHNAKPYLTEPMLYDLMLEMKTDKVKPFRKWVTNEVLPTIRKTGGYVSQGREEQFINNYFSSFSEDTRRTMLKDLVESNRELQDKLNANSKLIEQIEDSFKVN